MTDYSDDPTLWVQAYDAQQAALATALESLADWRARFDAQCERIHDLADRYNVDGDIYTAHDILALLAEEKP